MQLTTGESRAGSRRGSRASRGRVRDTGRTRPRAPFSPGRYAESELVCVDRAVIGNQKHSEGTWFMGHIGGSEPVETLRPIERRILDMSDGGESDAQIATRFRRSPGYVRRVRSLAQLPDRDAAQAHGMSLRPIERRVLSWRERGASYADIAARFRRSPAFIERVETIANYKLARA